MGVHFVGALVVRALLFCVHTRTLIFGGSHARAYHITTLGVYVYAVKLLGACGQAG